MSFNLALDGPAGAGKSTIAKKVAAALSFVYVDTGAMYRAMGIHFLDMGIDPADEAAISEEAPKVDVSIRYTNGEQQVYLNGVNVTGRLRTEEAGLMASATSKYAAVRSSLTALQKRLAAQQDVVMDGRDIGTTVLPNAQLKVYMTADSHVRAERRYHEYVVQNHGVAPAGCPSVDEIEADIIARDHQDMTREISPLKKADDAIELDTSQMDIDQVVAEIMKLVEQRRA